MTKQRDNRNQMMQASVTGRRQWLASAGGALVAGLASPMLLGAGQAFASTPADDAAALVSKSGLTLQKMADHADYGPAIHKFLKTAHAVLIIPQLLKGGFFIGGEGGSGVLLARGDDNRWSYPAFYTMGSGSFGLQFGASAAELVLIIRTSRGLSAILEDQVRVGGELNGALGPYGAGLEASTTRNLDADIISYAVVQGAFIGFAIEGSVIAPRESLNRAYYGTEAVSPKGIILSGQASRADADPLRRQLAGISQG